VVVDAGEAVMDAVAAPVLHEYVVAPPPVIVPAKPGQTVVEVEVVTGIGLTVTVETAVDVQPDDVPVTVYDVVLAGETEMAPVAAPVLQE
jgi:hypothetical protein